nr:ATPase [Bacteroidales bacterium]
CANGIVGISQGHDNVFVQTLIYAVLPEFYAILGLVCSLMV